MRRIFTPNRVLDLFGLGKDGFRNSNKGAGVPATELDAGLFNSWQEELAAIAEYGGGVLDPGNNHQLLDKILALIAGVSGVRVGTISIWPGAVAPTDHILIPTAATNISRTAYAELNTVFAALGYPWGVGDGATTFGLPWLAPDHTALQASGNVGTRSNGEVIAHTHGLGVTTYQGSSANTGMVVGAGSVQLTASTGGTANLAAGARFSLAMKYR